MQCECPWLDYGLFSNRRPLKRQDSFKHFSSFSLKLACNYIILMQGKHCLCSVSVPRAVAKQLLHHCLFLAALCLLLHLPKQRCPGKHQTFAFLPALEALHNIVSLLLTGDSSHTDRTWLWQRIERRWAGGILQKWLRAVRKERCC